MFGSILGSEGAQASLGQHPLMNAAQNMGMGAISNAQQQQAWNTAQLAQTPMVTKSSYPYKENKPRVSMQLDIVQADNGFIVNIGEEPYSGRTPFIATTIEDICTIITSQLASRMLDRVE
jgi:hypothetical protein